VNVYTNEANIKKSNPITNTANIATA